MSNFQHFLSLYLRVPTAMKFRSKEYGKNVAYLCIGLFVSSSSSSPSVHCNVDSPSYIFHAVQSRSSLSMGQELGLCERVLNEPRSKIHSSPCKDPFIGVQEVFQGFSRALFLGGIWANGLLVWLVLKRKTLGSLQHRIAVSILAMSYCKLRRLLLNFKQNTGDA